LEHRNRFILKGAMLFVTWVEAPFRPTRDLDLLGYGDNSPEAIRNTFHAILTQPVDDDGVAFDVDGLEAAPIREDLEYGGVRVRTQATIAGARIPIQVDVGFGDAITPGPIEIDYPALLDAPVPHLRAYPIETVVAEKFHALAARGITNSRLKDYYDLWLIGGIYPDGLAYSPETHKVYISDEHGGTDTVIDVTTNTRVATVQIGGVIGNTQYDAFSHHMFINAQSAEELVEVDPTTDTVVRRIKVPGAEGNHGLLIDSASHRAFIACEGNDRLIVMDLRTGAAIAQFPVAKDPDVLAFDAQRQTLYVAGESGQVSEFAVTDGNVSKSGEAFLALNAHVVAVQPATHEIYFPLMNVDGKPVLRIMRSGN
jgi:nucleotidyltransferase AbiEii toxin of type IV toxin-antitoxin system